MVLFALEIIIPERQVVRQIKESYIKHLDELLIGSHQFQFKLMKIFALNQMIINNPKLLAVEKLHLLEDIKNRVKQQLGADYTAGVEQQLFSHLPLDDLKRQVMSRAGSWRFVSTVGAWNKTLIKAAMFATRDDKAKAYFKPGQMRFSLDSLLHGFIQYLQNLAQDQNQDEDQDEDQDSFPKEYNPFVEVRPVVLNLSEVPLTPQEQQTDPRDFELLFDATGKLEAKVQMNFTTQNPQLLFGNLQPALAASPLNSDNPDSSPGQPYHLLLMTTMCLIFNMRDIKADALFAGHILADAEDFLSSVGAKNSMHFPKVHLPFMSLLRETALNKRSITPLPADWNSFGHLIDQWVQRVDDILLYLSSQQHHFALLTPAQETEIHQQLDKMNGGMTDSGDDDTEEGVEHISNGVKLQLMHRDDVNERIAGKGKILSDLQVREVRNNILKLKVVFAEYVGSGAALTIRGLVERFDKNWAAEVKLYKSMLGNADKLREVLRSSSCNSEVFPEAESMLRALESGYSPEDLAGRPRLQPATSCADKQSYADKQAFIDQYAPPSRTSPASPVRPRTVDQKQSEGHKSSPLKRKVQDYLPTPPSTPPRAGAAAAAADLAKSPGLSQLSALLSRAAGVQNVEAETKGSPSKRLKPGSPKAVVDVKHRRNLRFGEPSNAISRDGDEQAHDVSQTPLRGDQCITPLPAELSIPQPNTLPTFGSTYGGQPPTSPAYSSGLFPQVPPSVNMKESALQKESDAPMVDPIDYPR